MMPLNIAPTMQQLTVIKVSETTEAKRHLANLGIMAGSKIVLVGNTDGDIILNVKQTRIAINRQLAAKIFVR